MLIVSNKYRLAAVLLSKCASTTATSVLARLHDLPVRARDRDVLDAIPKSAGRIDRTSDLIALEQRRLVEARETFPDYMWFSIVRDPYGRLRSNYHNKINRFCAAFRKDLYLRYKLAQALGGPAAWRDVRLAMPYLQARVSYGEFVQTLGEKGLDWDPHYRRQSDLLKLDEVDYTRLLRMETLQDDMVALLRDAGLPASRIAQMNDLGRLNNSRQEKMAGTDEDMTARPKVYDLYRDDFERLGYVQ